MSKCIISPHYKDRDGYARKGYKGKVYTHHRLVYALHNGIDLDNMKGLVVMHTCDNPPCINLDHLRLGTNQDNSNDKIAKNRHAKGIDCKKSKLTESKVLEIRASSLSLRKLAKDYEVSFITIYQIKKRTTWTHI